MFTRAGVFPLREFALRAHPTIPSGRSPRYRTAGVTSLRGNTPALVAFLLLFVAVACNRPASWEQFVRAEDTVDGVYEFALDMSDSTATYDLSFYTAPLAEPLQLEVTWFYSSAEVFPVSQKHGHQEQKPREIVPGPPSDRDTGNTFTAPVFSETVWFPAGQHRALYRSGINFSDDLSTLVIPSAHSVIPGESKEPSSANYATAGSKSIKIHVTPINPPQHFRGLGIICKKNDGTR